jgi:glyoxylate/hydroxypyruvate reductase A
MTLAVLVAGAPGTWEEYVDHLRDALRDAGIDAVVTNAADPARVDYLVYEPSSGLSDFRAFTRLKAVLSLWAGVERIVGLPTLTSPLCRMVDPSLTAGMVEWVAAHVLRHHLGIDAHILGQDGVWRHAITPPVASERTVAILGLGELGSACAAALVALGFRVRGWSGRPRDIPGVSTFAGPGGLASALAGTEIVVLLLPDTPGTCNILNRTTLSFLAPGAVVINPGRGPLIDDDALIEALDSGHVGHATLDVFRTEPLPPDHVYWRHPRVTVTPHIAAATRAPSAARVVAENIRRGEAGEPFLYLVDRTRGY